MTPSGHPTPPSDDAVTWFGHSSRFIGNRPDSRYGWLETTDGPCVVKALDCEQVLYARSGPHGRRAQNQLQQVGAPAPRNVVLARPVWLRTAMTRIAPELRDALSHDHLDFRQACEAADVNSPGYSAGLMPADSDAANRRLWAEYYAPRQLQRLLEGATLSAAKPMQFAAGTSDAALAESAPDRNTASDLNAIARRMTAQDPRARFGSLVTASEAPAQLQVRPVLNGQQGTLLNLLKGLAPGTTIHVIGETRSMHHLSGQGVSVLCGTRPT